MHHTINTGRTLLGALARRAGRKTRIGASIAAIGGLVWLGLYVHHVHVQHRFAAVSDGQVYRSAAMSPEALLEVVRAHGIKTVIDLRKPKRYQAQIEAEHAALARAGVRHVNLPTSQVPKDPATVDQFLAIIGDPKNRPALIHCYHGTGRAMLFSSLYRIEFEDWDNDRARRATRWLTWGSGFSEQAGKGKYLLGYERKRAPEPKTTLIRAGAVR